MNTMTQVERAAVLSTVPAMIANMVEWLASVDASIANIGAPGYDAGVAYTAAVMRGQLASKRALVAAASFIAAEVPSAPVKAARKAPASRRSPATV